jgi:histone H3
VKQHEWCISHHYTRLILMFNGGCLPSMLNVLGHDGNTLGMNGAQVCILKHANKVSLRSLLVCKHCRALKTQVVIEYLSNLSYQTLEWRLANQKVSRLLVSPDLSKLP